MTDARNILIRSDLTTASGLARAGFVRRHAQLTLAALWEQSGRLSESIDASQSAIELATVAGDHHLLRLGRLAKAELLVQAGRLSEAEEILEVAGLDLTNQPGGLHAQYERILAFALIQSSSRDALSHYSRAENLPGLQGCRGNRRTRSPALGVGRKCEDVGLSWARTHQRADGSGCLANRRHASHPCEQASHSRS